MATIYDIAQFCNTSTATVSYVLNGNGDKRRISKATQEKILAAAEMLHYRPNTSAKRLSQETDRGLNIALFWPNYSFEQNILSTLRAVKSISEMNPDTLEIALQFYEPGHLAEKGMLSASQAYNGILLAGMAENDLEYLAECRLVTPLVLINRMLDNFPTATIDHRAAGQMACDLAVQKGGGSICTFWEQQHHVATNLRRSAFVERCEALNIDLGGRQFYCDGREESGYDQGIRLIQKKQVPKVIFCNHEAIARGLLYALTESGIRMGEEVFLFTTSVGPASYCRYCAPPLTAIDLKMQQVVEQALRMCLSLISHQPLTKNVVTLQPEIIFRDSFPSE